MLCCLFACLVWWERHALAPRVRVHAQGIRQLVPAPQQVSSKFGQGPFLSRPPIGPLESVPPARMAALCYNLALQSGVRMPIFPECFGSGSATQMFFVAFVIAPQPVAGASMTPLAGGAAGAAGVAFFQLRRTWAEPLCPKSREPAPVTGE